MKLVTDKKTDGIMHCACCEKDAILKCTACGKFLCSEHSRLRTLCISCIQKKSLTYSVRRLSVNTERKRIGKLIQQFWGEPDQLTFDRTFTVTKLPAYVAKKNREIMGFVSFAEENSALMIAALAVLPQYQSTGVATSLIESVEREARRQDKKRLLVSTSNDDLPALAFYQSLGFQIFEVKPNVIAEKHGKTLKGIAGLPVRDELRLQKILK